MPPEYASIFVQLKLVKTAPIQIRECATMSVLPLATTEIHKKIEVVNQVVHLLLKYNMLTIPL